MSPEDTTERRDLELQADNARWRLLTTMDRIRQHGRDLVAPAERGLRYAVPLGGLAGGLLVGFAGGHALGRHLKERRQLQMDSVPHGTAGPPPLLPALLGKAAAGLLSSVVTALAKRALLKRLPLEEDTRP